MKHCYFVCRFLEDLEIEVLKEDSPIWNMDYKPPTHYHSQIPKSPPPSTSSYSNHSLNAERGIFFPHLHYFTFKIL